MLNARSDRMSAKDLTELFRKRVDEEVSRRTAQLQSELRDVLRQRGERTNGFFEAMSSFLKLRDKLFPSWPADPAWKILVTLSQTPEDSPKASITGIVNGARVPMTTALRYIAALESEGIIERVAHRDDKRQVTIRLTPEGRRRLDTLSDRWPLMTLCGAVVPLGLFYYAWGMFGVS